MSTTDLPSFEAEDLASRVAQMNSHDIDALPFGVIRLDAEGRVSFFSRREAQLSGVGTQPTISRLFFSELAPCMDAGGIRSAVERAVSAGDFDLEFDHFGDFADATRHIRIRALPDGAGGVWLFTLRD